MSSNLKKIKKKFFNERIKSLVIIQSMLFISLLCFVIYGLVSNLKGNEIYDGVGFTIIALITMLRSLEYFILKKKENAIWYLIFAIISFYLGIDYLQR